MDLRKQKCVLDVKLESMITFANRKYQGFKIDD